jgi:hypothetical protein
MSWSLYRWVWKLEAPLYIGMAPSGSLNRCRLYVPARNIWGALTADVAQQRATGFPAYAQVGEDVRRDVRLTYLYPAEPTDRGWRAWLPRYEPDRGLLWQREDDPKGNDSRLDREMRRRLLLARPGTAIDHASDTAAEGTLRETECIGEYWRDIGGSQVRPVGTAGYVFLRETGTGTLVRRVREIETLRLGGDTRYGLGRLRRVEMSLAETVFGRHVELDGQDPVVSSPVLYGHGRVAEGLQGAFELLAGWDTAKDSELRMLGSGPAWAPGSTTGDVCVEWRLDEQGLWIQKEELGRRDS